MIVIKRLSLNNTDIENRRIFFGDTREGSIFMIKFIIKVYIKRNTKHKYFQHRE